MGSGAQSGQQAVVFEATPTDQALLEAVARELAQQRSGSFSDLCKQALQQFFLKAELSQSAALFVQMERQIVELQFKLAEVERRLAIAPTSRLDELTQQVQQLTQRLDQMKLTSMDTREPEPPISPVSLDPLLSRLGPLLEDF